MKWKKVISILLAAVLCMSFLAGCGGSPESQADKAVKEINKVLKEENEPALLVADWHGPEPSGYYQYVYKLDDGSPLTFEVSYLDGEFAFIRLNLDKDSTALSTYETIRSCLGDLSIMDLSNKNKALYQEEIKKDLVEHKHDFLIGKYRFDEFFIGEQGYGNIIFGLKDDKIVSM